MNNFYQNKFLSNVKDKFLSNVKDKFLSNGMWLTSK